MATHQPSSHISLDRAKSIADAAAAAGLATPPTNESEGWTFSPVLTAKLADLGVDKLPGMTTEQADAVEAFVAAAAI
jgi:hypothetical protein